MIIEKELREKGNVTNYGAAQWYSTMISKFIDVWVESGNDPSKGNPFDYLIKSIRTHDTTEWPDMLNKIKGEFYNAVQGFQKTYATTRSIIAPAVESKLSPTVKEEPNVPPKDKGEAEFPAEATWGESHSGESTGEECEVKKLRFPKEQPTKIQKDIMPWYAAINADEYSCWTTKTANIMDHYYHYEDHFTQVINQMSDLLEEYTTDEYNRLLTDTELHTLLKNLNKYVTNGNLKVEDREAATVFDIIGNLFDYLKTNRESLEKLIGLRQPRMPKTTAKAKEQTKRRDTPCHPVQELQFGLPRPEKIPTDIMPWYVVDNANVYKCWIPTTDPEILGQHFNQYSHQIGNIIDQMKKLLNDYLKDDKCKRLQTDKKLFQKLSALNAYINKESKYTNEKYTNEEYNAIFYTIGDLFNYIKTNEEKLKKLIEPPRSSMPKTTKLKFAEEPTEPQTPKENDIYPEFDFFAENRKEYQKWKDSNIKEQYYEFTDRYNNKKIKDEMWKVIKWYRKHLMYKNKKLKLKENIDNLAESLKLLNVKRAPPELARINESVFKNIGNLFEYLSTLASKPGPERESCAEFRPLQFDFEGKRPEGTQPDIIPWYIGTNADVYKCWIKKTNEKRLTELKAHYRKQFTNVLRQMVMLLRDYQGDEICTRLYKVTSIGTELFNRYLALNHTVDSVKTLITNRQDIPGQLLEDMFYRIGDFFSHLKNNEERFREVLEPKQVIERKPKRGPERAHEHEPKRRPERRPRTEPTDNLRFPPFEEQKQTKVNIPQAGDIYPNFDYFLKNLDFYKKWKNPEEQQDQYLEYIDRDKFGHVLWEIGKKVIPWYKRHPYYLNNDNVLHNAIAELEKIFEEYRERRPPRKGTE